MTGAIASLLNTKSDRFQSTTDYTWPYTSTGHPRWSQFSSVQFSCSVKSDSLQPHGLQHASLLCPSPTPRAYSNSCPSSQWCYTTISSSVIPISSCLQSFPASGSFPMSQFFMSGGQSIVVSASASVLPIHIQDWFPLGLTQILLICKADQRYHTLLYFMSYFRTTLWICPFCLSPRERTIVLDGDFLT